MTRQDKTRQDKTRQDKTRQDKTRQDKTRPWTTEELDYLIAWYQNKEGETGYDVAKFLDRNPWEIWAKCTTLRKQGVLKLSDADFEWTERRKDFLSANHDKKTWREIAKILGTSEKVVALQARKMGFKKKRLSDFDAEIRKYAAMGWFRKQIAQELGVDYNNLARYIRLHNIDCVKDEEGRLEGIRMKWMYHKELMAICYARRKKK